MIIRRSRPYNKQTPNGVLPQMAHKDKVGYKQVPNGTLSSIIRNITGNDDAVEISDNTA